MSVSYTCDRCNKKSDKTRFETYEGYYCDDITTFNYTNKDGLFITVDLCRSICIEKFKEESNIIYIDDRTPGKGFRGWKEMPYAP